MPRQIKTALAVVRELHAQGIPVHMEPGWDSRGSSTFNPRGCVVHHTADGPGEYPSLGIVRDGRGGAYPLPGPLAQWGLGRSGKVYLIAAGRANHAGRGGWRGLSGNTSVWGIEAESTGRGDWTPAQRHSYPRLVAALARHQPFSVDMVCAHREWTPRKPDPAGIDMPSFRAEVAGLLAGRPAPAPAPTPQEDPDMIPIDVQPGKEQVIWLEPCDSDGAGFLGTKAGVIIVTTHRPTHKVQIAAPAVGLGWDERTITNNPTRPFVHNLTNSPAARLVIRNHDPEWAIGGHVIYKR